MNETSYKEYAIVTVCGYCGTVNASIRRGQTWIKTDIVGRDREDAIRRAKKEIDRREGEA